MWRRRAQRKFRERQKQKLQESEGRARELQHALERLKMEKSALETRNALLEKMVGMKGNARQTPQPSAQIEEVAGQVPRSHLVFTFNLQSFLDEGLQELRLSLKVKMF